MKKRILFITALIMLAAGGCADTAGIPDALPEETPQIQITDASPEAGYRQISHAEALEMMKKDGGLIVIDVRRPDEYETGHIEGAVCIPSESIETEMPPELPDKEQTILVYCRTGRRSKLAAQKLCDMGYTNVYEFGGITDWIYGTVMEDKEPEEDMSGKKLIAVTVGDVTLYAQPEDNDSAEEFTAKLEEGDITLEMEDYGGFEKVGELPWRVTAQDEQITVGAGDIILYQGNKITLYYDSNTWSFTKLGHIDISKEELLGVLGDGSVTVSFSLEHK